MDNRADAMLGASGWEPPVTGKDLLSTFLDPAHGYPDSMA